MKVLDLKCTHQHVFEGWFASEDDFQAQRGRGLVSCPICGDAQVEKQLSAPRLNLGAQPQPPAKVPSEQAPAGVAAAMANPELQALWLKAMRQIMANTEDVGGRFADVARQMHYGQEQERGIRGQTTAEEAAELSEEGISVMPLVVPDALKGPLQ
jgi:hypothetical protein